MIFFLLIWNRLNIMCLNRNCCFWYFSIRCTFFSPGPPFSKPCPAMFLTSYSSIIIIQLKRRFVACAWSKSLPLSCACYTGNGRLKSSKKNNSMKYLEQRPPMAIFEFSVTILTQEQLNLNHIRPGTQLFFSI